MNTQDALVVQLKALALKIKDELQANISEVKPEAYIFIVDKILDFEYNKEGTHFSKTQNEYITESFYRVPSTIFDSIRNTCEYNSVLQDINASQPLVSRKSLDRFVEVIAGSILNKADAEEIIDTTITTFLKNIYKEPFQSSAVVELVGVVIDLESLELDSDIFKVIIRQVKIEDLEKKQPIYPYPAIAFSSTRKWLIPSAIIDIELYGNEPYKIRNEIKKIITVLRLFRVSSTDYKSYRMDSEAILWDSILGATFGSDKEIDILEKLKITKENASDLVMFYRDIKNKIPTQIYQSDFQEKAMIHLAIAYRHYSEALLSQIRIEEKITNAVIGLESLLLAENQEISFRFWVRGAKILGLLNYSPLEVKKNLKTAYDIRSTFVHGDDLELDKKLRKINKNKQETNLFLIELLDYLRVLIVVIIFLSNNKNFVKNNKFDKKKFLEIVDDSLISVEKEAELRELLSCVSSQYGSCLKPNRTIHHKL
uniref:Apea-like HEPN domain-containing protein n=1 Tax=Planktothrix pseudagardhii TaxID=132604 RepID=A0A9W4G4B3_9CYAN|nr:hypothetical protein NO713_01037 [Planktothrix pseudagardhii]